MALWVGDPRMLIYTEEAEPAGGPGQPAWAGREAVLLPDNRLTSPTPAASATVAEHGEQGPGAAKPPRRAGKSERQLGGPEGSTAEPNKQTVGGSRVQDLREPQEVSMTPTAMSLQ